LAEEHLSNSIFLLKKLNLGFLNRLQVSFTDRKICMEVPCLSLQWLCLRKASL